MLFAAFATSLAAFALCAPQTHPLIAEVFYDAVGDDIGHEFVELFNPSPDPYPLAGARLEAVCLAAIDDDDLVLADQRHAGEHRYDATFDFPRGGAGHEVHGCRILFFHEVVADDGFAL